MKKDELVEAVMVAASLETKAQAGRAVEAVFDTIVKELSLEIKQPLVENLRNETLKQLLLLVNPGSDSPNYKVYEVPDADTKQDPK
jgi:uncharacterized protein (DUF2267 family)